MARWAGPALLGRVQRSLFDLSASTYDLWGGLAMTLVARDFEEALLRPYRREEPPPPPSPLFVSACGARVGAHDLCRDVFRRRVKQELAPIPDFCSPDCPDCSVILDQHEESPPKPKDPPSIEMMTAHGKIKVVPHPMCREAAIIIVSGEWTSTYHLTADNIVTDRLLSAVNTEAGMGRTATLATLGLRAYARLNEERAMRRMYSAPEPRPRDPASERAATLRYRLDRKLARARARP